MIFLIMYLEYIFIIILTRSVKNLKGIPKMINIEVNTNQEFLSFVIFFTI